MRVSVVASAFRGGSLARAALPQPVPGVHGVPREQCRPSPGRGHLVLTTNTDIWPSRDVLRTLLGSCQESCIVPSRLIFGERSRYFGSVPSAGLCAYATAMVEPWVSRGGRPWQELVFMWAVTVVSAWESFRGQPALAPRRPPRLGLVASEGCSSIGYTRLTAHSGQLLGPSWSE